MLKYIAIFILAVLRVSNVYGQSLDQGYIHYYNPLTNGIECNGPTLNAAVNAIATNQRTLYFTALNRNKVTCTWSIQANIVIPENVTVWVPFGVKLAVDSGFTLTIDGCLRADDPNWYTGNVVRTFKRSCSDSMATSEQQAGLSFQGYVQSGCNLSLAGEITVSISSCTSWIKRVQDNVPILTRTFTTTDTSMSMTTTDGQYNIVMKLPGEILSIAWTCVTNAFCWALNTTLPKVPNNTVLIGTVIISGGVATEIGDLRPDAPLPGPVNVLSPLYGVVGDGVVDDTIAIQTAMTAGKWQGRPVYIPKAPGGDCYVVSTLYVHYDTVNNPLWPTSGLLQPNFEMYGDGPDGVQNFLIVGGPAIGTKLCGISTTAPVVYGDGRRVSVADDLQRLRLHKMSIIADTISAVVELYGMNNESMLDHLLIGQRNDSGDGLHLESVYQINIGRTTIANDDNGVTRTATGVGLSIANTTLLGGQSGGIMNVDEVTVRGWSGTGGRCIVFGSDSNTNASSTVNINSRGLQALYCDIGISGRFGAREVTFTALHIEHNFNTGVFMTNQTARWAIYGGYFWNPSATNAEIQIGDSSIGGDGTVSEVILQNVYFGQINATGVKRQMASTSARGLVISGLICGFKVAGVGTCLDLRDHTGAVTVQRGAILENVRYGSGQYSCLGCQDVEWQVGTVARDDGSGYNENVLRTNRFLGYSARGGQIAGAADITLNSGGNGYSITGTGVTVNTITCSFCNERDIIYLYVAAGATVNFADDVAGAGSSMDLTSTFVAASNDTLTLIFFAGKWRELARSSN